jgi:hypothetical protein
MHEREAWWRVVVDSKLSIREVGGVPMNLLGRMEWSYGKILGGVGGS